MVSLSLIVNQHIKFGCQEISGTEDIRYIKIQQSFEPAKFCDLALGNNNLSFKQNSTAYDDVSSK